MTILFEQTVRPVIVVSHLENFMKTIMKNLLLFIFIIAIPESFAGMPMPVCDTASITATAPDARYTDNGDATVTDKWTGLMWKQCAEGLSGAACVTGPASTFTWANALLQPGVVNGASGFAGHTDWRLPNIKELHSILEFQCFAPARNVTIFPDVSISRDYWSSTPSATSANSNMPYTLNDLTGIYLLQNVVSTMNVMFVRDTQ